MRRQPYSVAVDMWSLGVILYCLLSGHQPFASNSPELTCVLIEQGRYAPMQGQVRGQMCRGLVRLNGTQPAAAVVLLFHTGLRHGVPRVAELSSTHRSKGNGPQVWDGVSEGAKDLIRCLLVVDADERLPAQPALDHPWVAAVSAPMESVLSSGTGSDAEHQQNPAGLDAK